MLPSTRSIHPICWVRIYTPFVLQTSMPTGTLYKHKFIGIDKHENIVRILTIYHTTTNWSPMQTTLTPDVLYAAYSQGYFPMPDETGDILWFRPDPRAILPLDGFHVSRSLRRILTRKTFSITYDKAFSRVMQLCAKRQTTWINEEMRIAYEALHAIGHARSLEVWAGEELVGGVYGVHFGSVFFAESMFYRQANASKVALYHLVYHLRQQGFTLLECQFMTTHLQSLGATEISESEYIEKLEIGLQQQAVF